MKSRSRGGHRPRRRAGAVRTRGCSVHQARRLPRQRREDARPAVEGGRARHQDGLRLRDGGNGPRSASSSRSRTTKKLTILVSWMPDKGKDGPAGKKYSLSAVAKGKFDAGLRALGAQLATLKKSPIVRPMPEPNTPWYAWSGGVAGNTPAQYVKAWKHVRSVLRKADPKVRAAVGAVRAERAGHPAEHDRLVLPGRQERRSRRRERRQLRHDEGPRLVVADRPLRDGVHDDRGPREEAVLDRRDRLDRQGRRPARLDPVARRRCARRCPGSPASCGST